MTGEQMIDERANGECRALSALTHQASASQNETRRHEGNPGRGCAMSDANVVRCSGENPTMPKPRVGCSRVLTGEGFMRLREALLKPYVTTGGLSIGLF